MLLKKLRTIMTEADELTTAVTPITDIPKKPVRTPTRQDKIEKASYDGIANEESKYATTIANYLNNILKKPTYNVGIIRQEKSAVIIENSSQILDELSPTISQLIIAALGTDNFNKINTPTPIASGNNILIVITLKIPA